MIILSATDLTKAYGVDVILDGLSFHVNEGDRIGIVGANGAGKTTLLNILAGRDHADSGDFFVSKDINIGYLRQKDDFDDDGTLIEEVHRIYGRFEAMEAEIHRLSDTIAEMAAAGTTDSDDYHKAMKRLGDLQDEYRNTGGFSYKSEMKGILNSMAFGEEYYDKPIHTLSGGERTRLALACLLMEGPELLFLDEPTNHLDIGMLKWLEQYLRSYKGTILMVSHDRYFLDQMATRIFDVERKKLKCYEGNYSAFAEKKRAQREADFRAYGKQQEEIRRQEDIIRKFKERGTEHLAKRAASREKKLAAMDRMDRPEAELGTMKIHFRQEYKSGNDVLFGEGLSKSFGFGSDRRDLFENVDFDIKKGERICIVGPNGIGKTTLLRIMMGEITASEGYLKTGHNVTFGYYDQRQELLDDSKTVMDEVHDSYRLYKDSEIRGILGKFLFSSDQVFIPVGSLSGGEKARLALLKLMLSGTNVLVLDEPTNHLDIDSKEVFEDALGDYPGTVIAVSHDRYFLNKVATRIFELGPAGITQYVGGYDYYEEKKASIESGKKYIEELREDTAGRPADEELAAGLRSAQKAAGMIVAAPGEAPLSPAEERALKKKLQAEQKRSERERRKLEETIDNLETEIKEIQEEMCRPEMLSDSGKLSKLHEKLQSSQEELDFVYDEWLNL
jgi:ATP-binding cassette subfamily F protein 3